jgi:hypothetical protein
MFSCCKRLALDIYNFEYNLNNNPRILEADSAKSITKGFKSWAGKKSMENWK